ncbi:MAG: MFS transporter [Patescibacteria group bacterium]|jgi:MFS family permease|nr:MFS transporter [Patescibacteria group bacterium]
MYYQTIFKSIKNYQINLVIKILTISDFAVWSSYQLLMPIFAIFVTNKIPNGSIEVVGIASALCLLAKSVFEIPVGIYIDKHRGEKDDLYTSIFGTVLTAAVYFAYIFVGSIWELYLLQILLGLAAALAFPGWRSIFTRHLDKNKEALEWSLYDVITGFGMAASAALGGFIATIFGFDVLFIVVSVLTLIGAAMLLMIKDKIYQK